MSTAKTHKLCPAQHGGCGKLRNRKFFVKNGRICDTCRRGGPKAQRLPLEVKRQQHLLARYGLTVAGVEQLLGFQHGTCALCPTQLDWLTLRIDHNHKTGEVRGILCNRCNTAVLRILDTFENTEVALAKLTTYLLP